MKHIDETDSGGDAIVNRASRYDHINIGADRVNQCTAHLGESQRDLLRWLHGYARSKRLQWDDLSKAVGTSSTTLYRAWTTGQRVPLDELAERIKRFKSLADERDTIAQAGFVETSVTKTIHWVCQRTLVRQTVGLLYGESQIGKTTALLEFARRQGQTAYIELPPSAGVQLLAKTVAQAVHVSPHKPFDRLSEDIMRAMVGNTKLLIVDEVARVYSTYQKSSVMRCLDFLRWLHDQTRCGLVLCGTNLFRDNLAHGEFSQYLKQLRRRGINEVQLPPAPPKADLEAFACKFGIGGPHGNFEIGKASLDSEAVITRIAAEDGLGRYIMLCQDAIDIAKRKQEPPTWEHFLRAWVAIQTMAGHAPG